MSDQLTVQVKTVFNPERDTTKATRAAKQLIDIVKQNGWSIKLGGKSEHLMYEAWQTVGKYYNYTVATGEANPVEIGGISGFKAKAWVVDSRTGVRVGEAEAYCMRDEGNWKTKPTFQLASMAQTRAGAKALRQIFGFVVALAGYSPTPAEEMIGQTLIENKEVKTIYASEAQLKFVKSLLKQKGFTEKQLIKKFNLVAFDDLSKEQASLTIEKLQAMPDKSGQEKEEAVDLDEAEKGIEEINRGIAGENFPND